MRECVAQLAALAFNWPDFWFLVVLAFGARFFNMDAEIYAPKWLSREDEGL